MEKPAATPGPLFERRIGPSSAEAPVATPALAIGSSTRRQVPQRDEPVNPSGRRMLYQQALHASQQPGGPLAQVAMVLVEVGRAAHLPDVRHEALERVTARLANVINRRLRPIDLLVRTADTELAVLLTQSNLIVAASFSERLRQPIEQALGDMNLVADVVVNMGLASNPLANAWRPDTLIELADHRMRAARHHAAMASRREWALQVDGDALPDGWTDTEGWWPTAMDSGAMPWL